MWLKTLWRNFTVVLRRNGVYNHDVLHWSAAHRAAALLGATNPVTGGGTYGGHQLESRPLLRTPCLDGLDTESQDCGTWDGYLWAVPKKRTSHSKKRMRMAHKYLKPIHHYTICPNCQNVKLLHVLCGHCLAATLKKTAEFRRMKQQRRDEKRLAKQQALSRTPALTGQALQTRTRTQ